MTHLLEAPCRTCGHLALADPGQLANVLCGPCRLAEASLATAIQRLPAETPPPMVWSGSENLSPQDGSERAALVDPEYVCGMLCDHVVPGPVRALCVQAEQAGWAYAERHSRGGVVGGNGKQLAVADMWSVRFRRDGWMGYAVRRGAAWSSVCIAGEQLPPFLGCGLAELKEWLADPEMGGHLDQWVADIRLRKAEQAAAQKERTKAAAAARGTKRIDHAD